MSYETEVLQSELPVFIDVTAAWCAPCKAAAPVVAELALQHAGRLKVVVIDADEAPELVAALGVRGFPTFLGMRGGDVVARQAGFPGKRALMELASRVLES